MRLKNNALKKNSASLVGYEKNRICMVLLITNFRRVLENNNNNLYYIMSECLGRYVITIHYCAGSGPASGVEETNRLKIFLKIKTITCVVIQEQ